MILFVQGVHQPVVGEVEETQRPLPSLFLLIRRPRDSRLFGIWGRLESSDRISSQVRSYFTWTPPDAILENVEVPPK